MAAPVARLRRRALRIVQTPEYPLYVFTLRADEVLRVADISRISRDDAGKLIGYQRANVRKHIEDIVAYLNDDPVIFPNPIIMALSSSVKFKEIRGKELDDDDLGKTGTLEIPLPVTGRAKPAWIVDGQQRAVALSQIKKRDLPVPITGFVADSVNLQRDQFIRINNTKPLPRSLVTELLPAVDSPLPPRLAIRKAPAAICEVLNTHPSSPFLGLIRRASMSKEDAQHAVITDNSIVEMIRESLTQSSGCLYPYRDLTRNETDFDAIIDALIVYWTAVRDTFPEAWGRPPTESRLMHGVGIRSMGRLMDRILAVVNPLAPNADAAIRQHLGTVAPKCRWTEGTWDDLDTKWNALENTARSIQELSNYLIRVYVAARSEML